MIWHRWAAHLYTTKHTAELRGRVCLTAQLGAQALVWRPQVRYTASDPENMKYAPTGVRIPPVSNEPDTGWLDCGPWTPDLEEAKASVAAALGACALADNITTMHEILAAGRGTLRQQ